MQSETRGYGRSASLLTAAFGAAGLLVYLYFAIASHSLDSEEYGEVVVLWSAVYVISLTLFRPTEQLLARSLAERGLSGAVLRVGAAIQLAAASASVALVLALHGPIADDLLSGDETAYAVLLAALVGYAAAYYARGLFAGTRRFGLYAALLLVESAVRLGFAIAYAAGVTDDTGVVMIGIAVAPLVSLVVVPLVRLGDRRVAEGALPADFTFTHGGGFAAAVLLIVLSEQIIIGLGPLFVRATVDAEAAGKIFNILLVARAPLVLFQAIAASLLPHLARLRARGDAAALEEFRASTRRTALVDRRLRRRGDARSAGDRAAGHADRVRRRLRVRPARTRDRRRRDGLLPLCGDPQPGGARPGPGPARGGLLGRLRDRVRGHQPAAGVR